jgi:hypothetical protein
MAISKKDLGAQLTEDLNRVFQEEYRKQMFASGHEMDSYNMATTTTGRKDRVRRPDYDINTDTYRSGIETWHARGAEHHLVKQLEDRLSKMDTVHKQEMRNLANQVISMNNAIEARVMHINGFYTWLIETYPETVAQYKALLNLKRLNEEGEE